MTSYQIPDDEGFDLDIEAARQVPQAKFIAPPVLPKVDLPVYDPNDRGKLALMLITWGWNAGDAFQFADSIHGDNLAELIVEITNPGE